MLGWVIDTENNWLMLLVIILSITAFFYIRKATYNPKSIFNATEWAWVVYELPQVNQDPEKRDATIRVMGGGSESWNQEFVLRGCSNCCYDESGQYHFKHGNWWKLRLYVGYTRFEDFRLLHQDPDGNFDNNPVFPTWVAGIMDGDHFNALVEGRIPWISGKRVKEISMDRMFAHSKYLKLDTSYLECSSCGDIRSETGGGERLVNGSAEERNCFSHVFPHGFGFREDCDFWDFDDDHERFDDV